MKKCLHLLILFNVLKTPNWKVFLGNVRNDSKIQKTSIFGNFSITYKKNIKMLNFILKQKFILNILEKLTNKLIRCSTVKVKTIDAFYYSFTATVETCVYVVKTRKWMILKVNKKKLCSEKRKLLLETASREPIHTSSTMTHPNNSQHYIFTFIYKMHFARLIYVVDFTFLREIPKAKKCFILETQTSAVDTL